MSNQRRSLVLVTIDCLRADHCGFYGYPRPTTPFLDTLAEQAFVLPTALVAGAPTYYSLPAILASRMPLALGRDVIGLAPGETTLASVLREAGYVTGAFSAANPYISSRFGYEQGFDVFEDFLGSGKPPSKSTASSVEPVPKPPETRSKINRTLSSAAHAIGLGAVYDEFYFQYCRRIASSAPESADSLRRFPAAEAVVSRAIEWLETVGQKPFFLWLHLMDPHSPYYPSLAAYEELTGRKLSAERALYLNEYWNRANISRARLEHKKHDIVELYDAGVRAADMQIARLLSHLRASGAWADCAFALTADHGEEFLEHGRRYHAPVSLHAEITRVPLLIRMPGAIKKDLPPDAFSQVHLAPTLLEMLDVPQPPSFQGSSLWGNIRDGLPWEDAATMECVYGCTNPLRQEHRERPRLLSVCQSGYKLILPMDGTSSEEFYDMQADPAEKHPMAANDKEIRKQLFLRAAGHMRWVQKQQNAHLRLRARLRNIRVDLQSNPH